MKIEYDSARGKRIGRLVLGSRPTECCTSVALADTPYGAAAIMGVMSGLHRDQQTANCASP